MVLAMLMVEGDLPKPIRLVSKDATDLCRLQASCSSFWMY